MANLPEALKLNFFAGCMMPRGLKKNRPFRANLRGNYHFDLFGRNCIVRNLEKAQDTLKI
jgi:hypothetical protein